MSKRAADIEKKDGRPTAVKQSLNSTPNHPGNPEINHENQEMGEFEDPYGDEFESEEEIFEAGDEMEGEMMDEEGNSGNGSSAKLSGITEEVEEEKENDGSKDENSSMPPVSENKSQRVYLPHRSAPLGPDEVMEPDPSTYHMLHSINVKWPCLSFDILEDHLGDERRGYPQTMYLVTGTQAQKARDNEISVMKFSSLSKTLVQEDDDDDEEEDEGIESDPVLETKSLPTQYTTNRIRVNPFANKTGEYLTASMSESGDVYIWDISPHIRSFDNPGTVISKQMNRPAHTINVHGRVEGYAVDWSPLITTGSLLTGDISSRIHLSNRTERGWTTDRTPFTGHEGSIEEIQWSRTEKSVFASAGSDGFIKIWDTRSKKHQSALSVKASPTDINVMSWNSKIGYLLCSGHDDGQWGVWDLRNFKSGNAPSPVAQFGFHKSPITSIEFNPNDESVVAVASEDNTVTLWDLSVEADDEEIRAQKEEAKGDLDDIPSQLLFVHWQRHAKEVHWHKQLPGTLISTGSDGFSLWRSISV